jgi:hypothetical protein
VVANAAQRTKDGGQFQRISRDEALAEIKTRWSDIIARYGPQAIMPRPTSGVRSSAIITLIIPSAQYSARAEVDANVPVRLLRRAVRTVSIRTILALLTRPENERPSMEVRG